MANVYYKGKILSLVEARKKINGRYANVIKIIERNAIVVLPLIGKDKILLEMQYRPAIGKRIYELPAGHIEKGEKPVEAVRRELKEETGYTPKKVRLMFSAYPNPGTSTSVHRFYYAYDFEKGRAEPEIDEDIKIRIATISKVLEMIKGNEIIDTKSIAAVLYYANFIKAVS